MQPKNLEDLIKDAAERKAAELAAEIREAQLKIITVAYDKAATYTTVIVFGGYAGFFGIWQLTKDWLTKSQTLWSALCILISMVSFITFEVVKMVVTTRSVHQRANVLTRPDVQRDPQRLVEALGAIDKTQQAMHLGFVRFWAISVAISVVGALIGTGILGYAFVSELI